MLTAKKLLSDNQPRDSSVATLELNGEPQSHGGADLAKSSLLGKTCPVSDLHPVCVGHPLVEVGSALCEEKTRLHNARDFPYVAHALEVPSLLHTVSFRVPGTWTLAKPSPTSLCTILCMARHHGGLRAPRDHRARCRRG